MSLIKVHTNVNTAILTLENTNRRERLSTVDLLIVVACFVEA
jgi:hypothetical protein